MGHMGMDFSADAGAEVVCVYDGVVESVTTSYLTGTTVTVDHGNNLKTVYNSIDANEALYEGATVAKGTVLGYVSENNLQEYKDGPHLHFEVLVSGETVNPDEYLIGEEK
jgi:murein DD-endopeptidase MepM/ murein hydrolase activator NlpD